MKVVKQGQVVQIKGINFTRVSLQDLDAVCWFMFNKMFCVPPPHPIVCYYFSDFSLCYSFCLRAPTQTPQISAAKKIEIRVNGAKARLFNHAMTSLPMTLAKARVKMRIQDQTTVPPLQECVNSLFSGVFLAHLLEKVNAVEVPTPIGPFTKEHLQTCFNVLLLLHVHRRTPTSFFAELRAPWPSVPLCPSPRAC